jgi:hypothetical protein
MDNNKKYLSKEDLQTTQGLNNEYRKLESAIGSLEIEKHGLMQGVESLRAALSSHEQMLKEKYGDNIMINMATGEISGINEPDKGKIVSMNKK